MRLLLFPALTGWLAFLALQTAAWSAEPLLRPGDVVALAGGEEMVALAERGELELALAEIAPELHNVFRSLAWEGDTVYEQRRDLNYPTLPQQLSSMAATVVLVQLGQMESLQGVSRLPAFLAAAEKLLGELAGTPARRVILLLPHDFTRPGDEALPDLTGHNAAVEAYSEGLRTLAQRHGWAAIEWSFSANSAITELMRDGIHLNEMGEHLRARSLASQLVPAGSGPSASFSLRRDKLQGLIRQKNRLWFNFYRPQNWAFLAGDRTNQPSSRDHMDPSKRWFPVEMEQYAGLIAGLEHAIWEAAAVPPRP